MKVKCDQCGKEFDKCLSRARRDKHSFCSKECHYRWRFPNYKKKANVKCDWCGDEFERHPSQVLKHKFCSRKCMGEWQSKNWKGENHPNWEGGKKAKVSCDYCGKVFKKWGTVVPKSEHHFCSRECGGNWRAENLKGKNHFRWSREERKCDCCGKVFEIPQWQIKRGKNHFCSRECMCKWESENLVGENNPHWKGGYEPYYGPNWLRQRRKARVRDNYTCQICGEKEDGRKHDVHHIIPFREFGLEKYNEANQLSNLITFCHPCHGNIESKNSATSISLGRSGRG